MQTESNQFPNGVDSFLRTYFSVASYITMLNSVKDSYIISLVETENIDCIYEIAERLTKEYEEQYSNKEDNERLDLLHVFLDNTFKQLNDGTEV